MLNFVKFGVLPFVEIDHVMQECLSLAGTYQRIVRVVGNFHSKILVLYNKNSRGPMCDRFPQKFDVQT